MISITDKFHAFMLRWNVSLKVLINFSKNVIKQSNLDTVK